MAEQPVVGALATSLSAELHVPVFVMDVDSSLMGDLVLLVPYSTQPYGGTIRAYMEMIQVRVAASSYPASVDLATTCYDAILALTSPADADRRVFGPITALQPPFLLGYDDQNRVVHIFNIAVPVIERGVE